jgi:hypothetical protein
MNISMSMTVRIKRCPFNTGDYDFFLSELTFCIFKFLYLKIDGKKIFLEIIVCETYSQ